MVVGRLTSLTSFKVIKEEKNEVLKSFFFFFLPTGTQLVYKIIERYQVLCI